MHGWPTWFSRSWARTNSLITGFMASLVLYLMRVMTEISPLITSNICAGLAFPTPLPSLTTQCFLMDTSVSYSWYPPGTSCKGRVVATGVKLFPEKGEITHPLHPSILKTEVFQHECWDIDYSSTHSFSCSFNEWKPTRWIVNAAKNWGWGGLQRTQTQMTKWMVQTRSVIGVYLNLVTEKKCKQAL